MWVGTELLFFWNIFEVSVPLNTFTTPYASEGAGSDSRWSYGLSLSVADSSTSCAVTVLLAAVSQAGYSEMKRA